MGPAEFLTARAAELRDLAGAATVAPWTAEDSTVRSPGVPRDLHPGWPHSTLVLEAVYPRDAAFTAHMDPDLAMGLADAIADVVLRYAGRFVSNGTPVDTFESRGRSDDLCVVNREEMTHQEFVDRFMQPAPAHPVERALARIFHSHPDFDPAWRT